RAPATRDPATPGRRTPGGNGSRRGLPGASTARHLGCARSATRARTCERDPDAAAPSGSVRAALGARPSQPCVNPGAIAADASLRLGRARATHALEQTHVRSRRAITLLHRQACLHPAGQASPEAIAGAHETVPEIGERVEARLL